jgi:hypothetical protein
MPARFEPLPRDPGVDDGVAARIHDPMWFLCRQWQFGEFRGEDAGSIAMVNVDVDTHRLDRWRVGTDGDWQPYDPSAAPLERMVEEERSDPAADPRLRTQGGLRLTRRLTAAGLDPAPWAARYAFEETVPERAARGLNRLLRSRIGDGARIADGLRQLLAPATSAAEAAALGLADGQRDLAQPVATDWLSWWGARVPAGGPAGNRMPAAWNDHRLEHGFATRATGLPDVELRATEYDGGTLDWWSMDVVTPEGDPGPGSQPRQLELSGIPAPASFGGMPSSRFWEMEDAKIDLGAVDAAPQDLGRLLMVGYATVYGNDWYVVPVRMPIGTLCRITTFTVTNVFGLTEVVGPAAVDSRDFNLFGLADPREHSGANPWFLLAPALPGSLESAPIEHVLIARDEMANLAWAIEQRVEDDAGVPYDRYDGMTRPRPAVPGAIPAYRVDSFVPDFWYPLAPEHIDEGREAVRLRLFPLARRESVDGAAGAVTTVLPLGGILEAARGPDPFWLHEEEVPRSGVDVVRSHQRARWHDGSVHTWTTRRKGTGAGESASGLRFDTVTGS